MHGLRNNHNINGTPIWAPHVRRKALRQDRP
jgi:hypothetical protein